MTIGHRYWTVVALFACAFCCATHLEPYPSQGINPKNHVGNKYVRKRKQVEKKAKRERERERERHEQKELDREAHHLQREADQLHYEREREREEAEQRERGIRRAREALDGVYEETTLYVARPQEWANDQPGEYKYGLEDNGEFWREKARGRAKEREYLKGRGLGW